MDIEAVRERAVAAGLVHSDIAEDLPPSQLAAFVFHPGFSTARSVSEISGEIKELLGSTFASVWVSGEISDFARPRSGHCYFTLKDEGPAIESVCWRGTVGRLGLRVEEGMEVICTGRVSSYPRSSRYQIVIESIELAGEGALLKLLEDRREGERELETLEAPAVGHRGQELGPLRGL